MTTIEMRNAIREKYGKDSFEAGFAQHLFADREKCFLESYYNELFKKVLTK